LQIADFNSTPFRQVEIKRREEEARRREQIEQRRLAEQHRQHERKERLQREEQIRHNSRVASLESQWAQFSRHVAHAQRQRMQRAFMQHLDNTFNELERFWNPPPPMPEPEQTEIVYLSPEERESPRLGDPDFNPRLFAHPLRWR
jgi:hypothetical protein